MKFRVDVMETKLVRLPGGVEAVQAKLRSRDGYGEVTVVVAAADTGDFKAGDSVVVEVRARRAEDAP